MKIMSTTRIKDLSRKQFKSLFNSSIEFCEINLGINNRKRDPLRIEWNWDITNQTYGYYLPFNNTILLNGDCITVSDFTRTLIHEWTHQLQPITTKYQKLYRIHGYDTHPMEIEARESEIKWNRKLLNYVRKSMK